ncbi:carboxypeptidase-like regulatory domain-containing protein [Flavobacterium lacisediminis]|uniref:Carboxypeptidase-like regulatory domain-containing protein n=1 Tax=Flavobacterium lacisediminis TaxID=2989705 RepID=A0ABT3EEK1_9FLAO|nr:carboxypeptidase-like regulatory domain-containing protein [Flavobacterium lacisediminis]MCW1147006.1 carboxypeptidase-like regulatory domain-containing protein [Flavobacterium lacisediminis]
MIKDKVNISINRPCSQKFENFERTDKGGYCNSCRKEVLDFRNFTDNEIVDFFSKNQQKTCGVFLEKQLKNYCESYLDSNHKSKKVFYKSLLGVSFLSLFTFNEGFSQTTEKETINHEIKNIEAKNSKQNIAEQEITKGFVFDELGPIAGASVTVKNTNLSTSTDFDGNFIFNKKLNVGDVIIVSYIGFKTKEFTISDLMKIDIAMDSYSGELIMVGEVDVKKVYKSKKTFFQRIKDIF